jgi:hypothetical protein
LPNILYFCEKIIKKAILIFKKMKKIVLIAAILVMSGVEINAQTQHSYPRYPDTANLYKDLQTNKDFFENSDYILEVKRLSKDITIDYYASKKGADVNIEDEHGVLTTAIDEDDIHIVQMVKVLRVYKGENVKEGDTIVAFAKGGYLPINATTWSFFPETYRMLGNADCIKGLTPQRVTVSTTIGKGNGYLGDRGIDISNWDPSIIFGSDTEFPKDLDKPENDHYLKIKVPNRTKAKLSWEDGKFSGLNSLHFENRYELYKYMAQFEGIDIPLSDYDKMHKYWSGDDDARNQYIKEWNIDLKQRSDSVIRFMLQQREELLKSVEKKSRIMAN